MKKMQSKADEAKVRWSKIIDDQKRKGLSAYAYCKEARLNPNLFYVWRKRLKSKNTQQDTSKGFVRMTAPLIEKQRAGLVVKTPNGYEIKIDSSTEAELIKQVLEMLADG